MGFAMLNPSYGLLLTHPVAKDISVKTAKTGFPVPLHPGAERYYREVGIIK